VDVHFQCNLRLRGFHCASSACDLGLVTCDLVQEAEAKAAGSEERERATNERLTKPSPGWQSWRAR